MEELEEALRQSVIITAEREMAMADLQGQLEDAKSAVRYTLPLNHVVSC